MRNKLGNIIRLRHYQTTSSDYVIRQGEGQETGHWKIMPQELMAAKKPVAEVAVLPENTL